ncbi:shikimate dehydrogenase [Buchnera aphidicola (Brachycaudus cardui)]|uniref:Shikimate dehydrogenase (NADP(+)) n=1 Tax=Buchnera aphidicola (Brachycaudus cardui) TaxID=557993 RepID=A0A4D6XTX2_9GAMM|nr:shikimate dehydrogenase [Buchnera aphidicola]QCI20616.1 shikimate dehydrogenase [Buchnera aphidicola (Brachycaudus cardui)]
MFKNKKFNYALFGNPVDHSKSPQIHNFFSKQTGLLHTYTSYNVLLSNFNFSLSDFFQKDGLGANITAPFKEEAFSLSHQLTERAKIAQSVNTLKKVNNECILGDNTDGIGLLSDLIRLNFIKKQYSILILGAGGAAKGVIFPLLSFGCSIFILNRTSLNAQKLVTQFNKYGKVNVFDPCLSSTKKFDLVINATSKNIEKKEDFFPLSCISSHTCFYDMNYQFDNTPFINWCIKKGYKSVSNGIGMLVFQASHSFFLWHNQFPETDYIINLLNKNY